jgi:hypothetical protein
MLFGSNALNWIRDLRLLRLAAAQVSPCGRLTYRQTLPVKRKPYDEIAASQQTLGEPGSGQGQEIETAGRLSSSEDVLRRRPIATSYQDGLGIGGVIGLIQFVRSASGRG